jgi:hypothetical protein
MPEIPGRQRLVEMGAGDHDRPEGCLEPRSAHRDPLIAAPAAQILEDRQAREDDAVAGPVSEAVDTVGVGGGQAVEQGHRARLDLDQDQDIGADLQDPLGHGAELLVLPPDIGEDDLDAPRRVLPGAGREEGGLQDRDLHEKAKQCRTRGEPAPHGEEKDDGDDRAGRDLKQELAEEIDLRAEVAEQRCDRQERHAGDERQRPEPSGKIE